MKVEEDLRVEDNDNTFHEDHSPHEHKVGNRHNGDRDVNIPWHMWGLLVGPE